MSRLPPGLHWSVSRVQEDSSADAAACEVLGDGFQQLLPPPASARRPNFVRPRPEELTIFVNFLGAFSFP
ncbi:MAG: hypothetical protein ACTHKT_14510 [Solirubrobacterales bacterium]